MHGVGCDPDVEDFNSDDEKEAKVALHRAEDSTDVMAPGGGGRGRARGGSAAAGMSAVNAAMARMNAQLAENERVQEVLRARDVAIRRLQVGHRFPSRL